MRFEALKEAFLSHLVLNKGRSPRTAESYGLALDRLVAFAQGKDPMQLDADELTLFTGPWLHKMGISARARRPYVAAVRMFFKWAASRRELRGDPSSNLPYPRYGVPLPIALSLQNAERLMWAPDFTTFEGLRDATIMAVLAGTGLRVSGLVALNEGHVLPETRRGKPRLVIRVVEKGGRERRIPLPAEVDLLLRMYLEHPMLQSIDRQLEGGDRVLFVSMMNRRVPAHDYRGEARRLSRKAIYSMVSSYGKKIGLPPDQAHPHAFRHLFGTELAESGVDLLVRQKLMGHADPKSTSIYESMAMRRLGDEMDRANPLSKMKTPVTELLAKLGVPGGAQEAPEA